MNPTNFLTETYIFQFEQLTFNGSYHTEGAIQSFLNNTFMKGAIPGDSGRRTYAKAFFEIGKSRRLSPIHLASRVYQEQGAGNSALISGNYKGYEGYYNYMYDSASPQDKELRKRYNANDGRDWTIGWGHKIYGKEGKKYMNSNIDKEQAKIYFKKE